MSQQDSGKDEGPEPYQPFSPVGNWWITPTFIRMLMESHPGSAIFDRFEKWLDESPSERNLPVYYSWGFPDFAAAIKSSDLNAWDVIHLLKISEIQLAAYELGFEVPTQYELMQFARALDWPMVRFYKTDFGFWRNRTRVGYAFGWPKTLW